MEFAFLKLVTYDTLERFGMRDCKPARTPLNAGAKLHELKDEDDISDPGLPYRELLGSLMYLAQGTCPDIAYAVSALSQYNTCYSKTHWTCAKKVLRYLKGSIDYGLNYTKSGRNIIGYVDADWGNCGLDRRSYTGSVFLLSNAAISWESNKEQWHCSQQKRNILPSATLPKKQFIFPGSCRR